MKNVRQIQLLCSASEIEKIRPILQELNLRGIYADEFKKSGKDDIVLAILSQNFYADAELTERLLELIGSGTRNVLPLQLDATPIPDTLKNALYARNIIPAAGRDAALIAERIVSALPQKNSRLPLILGAAGLVLLILVGVIIWRINGSGGNSPITGGDTVITVPEGWTEEDLARIEDVLIIGDKMIFLNRAELDAAMQKVQDYFDPGEEAPFIYYDADLYAVLDQSGNDGQIHWYDMENGQELGMIRHDDLRFLSLMPNLRYLSLVLVDVPEEGLPDLRGAENLEGVAVLSCGIEDLGWLSGANVRQMQVRFTPIRDFSALGNCTKLGTLHVDMFGTDTEGRFSSFSSPALHNFSLWNADFSSSKDLRGLSSLSSLKTLQLLTPDGLQSLEGLQDLQLKDLEIVNGFDIQDISALSSQKQLISLRFDDCPGLKDYSPVGDCGALESVMIYAGMDVRLQDASFLGALSQLRDISLYSIDLTDLDFLTQLGQKRESLDNLDFSGDIRDFSALTAIKHYERLGIDLYYGNMGRLPENLRDISVSYLYLRRLSNLDLSALPTVTERLFLYDCDCRDLSSIPENWTLSRIQLYGCSELRSLNGLERLEEFTGSEKGALEVYSCPRLADWSSLDGARLQNLIINGSFSLPSFQTMQISLLRLKNVEDLKDLSFLNMMDASMPCSFELVGLDGLTSLEPLRRFHGEHISVSPQLEEQARDLVSEGLFETYRVEYPRGGWYVDDSVFVLESLDDLRTLPKALLRRVSFLRVAGDRLIDSERFEIIEDTALGVALLDRDTGNMEAIGEGELSDLSILSDLSGLHELYLYNQPFRSLEGVQSLSELEHFCAEYCGELMDASAIFTLQGLTEISLKGSPVSSIEGVQNLYELRSLDISHTNVSDLSCLISLLELETVTISSDMTKAMASLAGREYMFTLCTED